MASLSRSDAESLAKLSGAIGGLLTTVIFALVLLFGFSPNQHGISIMERAGNCSVGVYALFGGGLCFVSARLWVLAGDTFSALVALVSGATNLGFVLSFVPLFGANSAYNLSSPINVPIEDVPSHELSLAICPFLLFLLWSLFALAALRSNILAVLSFALAALGYFFIFAAHISFSRDRNERAYGILLGMAGLYWLCGSIIDIYKLVWELFRSLGFWEKVCPVGTFPWAKSKDE